MTKGNVADPVLFELPSLSGCLSFISLPLCWVLVDMCVLSSF